MNRKKRNEDIENEMGRIHARPRLYIPVWERDASSSDAFSYRYMYIDLFKSTVAYYETEQSELLRFAYLSTKPSS